MLQVHGPTSSYRTRSLQKQPEYRNRASKFSTHTPTTKHPRTTHRSTHRLTVAPEREGVVPLPRLAAAGRRLVVAVALAETARLLAGGGEAAGFAVLVDGLCDPVDTRVAADGLVLGVDKDDLEVLIRRVLVDPVRVEDAEVGAAAADALFGGGFERALVFELVHSLVGGLAICGTLGNGPLPSTSPHTHTVDDIALLGLVSETASLIGTGGTGGAMDDFQLAKLPAADAHQEADQIRLFLLLQLFNILEGAHLD